MIGTAPRLATLASKGRIKNVGTTPWFLIKMVCALAALALQIALLITIVQQENYPSSAIFSSSLYIVSIVSTSLPTLYSLVCALGL